MSQKTSDDVDDHASDASDARTSSRGLPVDYVTTPGGPRHKSKVHRIEKGHVLRCVNGRLRQIDAGGNVIREFAAIERHEGRPLHPLEKGVPSVEVPDLGDGWIVFGSWVNVTGQPISLFRTTWVVPPVPVTRDDQLVYIFNGIQNSTMIYQPVLQWGDNGIHGGGYWGVASWYADGKNGHAFHTDLVKVQPGVILVGTMTLIAQTGALFDYNCEFQNIDGTALPIQQIEELTNAVETLEAYYINRASNYPERRIQMGSIELRTGANPAPANWDPIAWATDTGQASRILNANTAGSGEIDLYCYSVKSLAFLQNKTGRVELIYTSSDDAIYLKTLLAPLDGWGGDQPVINNIYAKQVGGAVDQLGLVELFYVGTNNELYHVRQLGGGAPWTSEEHLVGAEAQQLSVGTNGDGRIEVFYVGMNNRIYHTWQQWSGGWHAQAELGGYAKQVFAVNNQDGRIELLYIGTDDELYHNWQVEDNGLWNGEAAFGGAAKKIVACRNAIDCIEMVYIGTDDRVYVNKQAAANNGWTGERPLGGSAKDLAMCQNQQGFPVLVYVGTDDNLYYNGQDIAGFWTGETKLVGQGKSVAMAKNTSGYIDLVILGLDGLLDHMQQKPNSVWGPRTAL